MSNRRVVPHAEDSEICLTVPGGPKFRWTEPFAEWLDSRREAERRAWIHSGIAVCRNGDVVLISHEDAILTVLGPNGQVRRTFPAGVTQGHGLHIAPEGDGDVLWVADNGFRRERDEHGDYPSVVGARPGSVVKLSMDGRQLMRIEAPPLPAYDEGRFCPTGIAVHDEVHGGNGDVWVADGYGECYVHRFRRDGSYVSTLSGEEGAGRFACPHAVWIDYRRQRPELYVSDRMNHRLQVFSLDGEFRRVVGNYETLRRPGGFALSGDHLMVTELEARLAVLDADGMVVGYLGGDDEAAARPGFPNQLIDHTLPQRPSSLRPGLFNSPHGIASDRHGNLYITEWLIGGRVVVLVREGRSSA